MHDVVSTGVDRRAVYFCSSTYLYFRVKYVLSTSGARTMIGSAIYRVGGMESEGERALLEEGGKRSLKKSSNLTFSIPKYKYIAHVKTPQCLLLNSSESLSQNPSTVNRTA